MAFAKIQTSFGAGELSPSLFARVDLAKYAVGAALLRNFFVDYRGGGSNRAGSAFVAQANPAVPGQPVLIPFTVSTVAAYMIEVGNLYMRFYSNGGPVLEAPVVLAGLTQANPGVFNAVAHGYAPGDEVQLSAILGPTVLNGKSYLINTVPDADHFTLKDLFGTILSTATLPAYISGGISSRVYTLPTPYITADLPTLKYTQSSNVLTLTHINYPPYDLTRTSSTSFSLTLSTVGAKVFSVTGQASTQVNSGGTFDTSYGYVVTAVSQDGKEESAQTFPTFTDSQFMSGTNYKVAQKTTWTASASNVSVYNVYKVGPFPSRASGGPTPPPTVYGFIGQSTSTEFIDNQIAPDFSRTPPQFQDPFSPGQIATIRVTGGGAGYTTQNTVPLVFTGDGTGAVGYGVVDPSSHTIIGAVIINPGKNYTACVVTDSIGSATYSVTLGQESGTYPACVTYFQQRRAFGGTPNFPESIVLSQPGAYTNFDTSAVSSASDGITISIASRQDNSIKSMVAMPTGLIVFTTGGGFLISGGNQNAAITPSDIVAFPQASSGANDLPPLVVNYDVLYCQNRGFVVRDLAFNFYVQSYTGTDRSVLASHLFLGRLGVSWTYAEEPFRQILVVRDDGVMLSFTYVPEQEVFAWTHYDTNGLYRSVASIPEGQENAVYQVVQRFVRGQFVYYIERIASRVFARLEDAWFTDAALKLGEISPAANLLLSSASGDGVTCHASSAVFSLANVGDILWDKTSGQALVTAYTSSTQVTLSVLQPFPTFPNDPDNTPLPISSGDWTLDTPVTQVSGLDHLEGKIVTGLSDGVPIIPVRVVNGSITLPVPATKVIVGLGFQSQLQTLQIDLGEPTVQGKRKNIPAVTLRVDKTLGLKAGPTFDSTGARTMVELKDLQVPYSPPVAMYSGDARVLIPSWWNKPGQICIQQDAPLPASVLGIIPEVVVGDTQK